MAEQAVAQRDCVVCEMCGEAIELDKHCYQIRYGYLEGEGNDGIAFRPEEDVAYHCEGCGVERGNFSS